MSDYVVGRPPTSETNRTTLAPGTYFVLTQDDPYAYAALWGYAQSLQLILESHPEWDAETIGAYEQRIERLEAMAKSWQAASREGS